MKDILDNTSASSKFSISRFKTTVNKYIDTNSGTRWLLDPDGNKYLDAKGHPVLEKCVMSLPGFCQFAGIDCVEDFWRLMQHKNREYAQIGKKLMTAIRSQAIDFSVNEKNSNYLSMINKTYFPDDKDDNVLTPLPEEVKKEEKGVDIKNEFDSMSSSERIEALRNLKKLLK